jgi:hypothetical protein
MKTARRMLRAGIKTRSLAARGLRGEGGGSSEGVRGAAPLYS